MEKHKAMQSLTKTAGAAALAVFLFLPPPALSEGSSCMEAFNTLRNQYSDSRVQLTVVGSDPTAVVPYVMMHAGDAGGGFDILEHLNGEIRGYALKGDSGFDYNHDRSATGPVSWHPTLVWHKLLSKGRQLRGYTCIFTGRTRLAGHRVSLLRLVPQDSLRYSFLFAMDDEFKMPVELSVLTPEGAVASRITVLGMRPLSVEEARFPLDEKVFENFKIEDEPLRTGARPWTGLTIPKEFDLKGEGQLNVNGAQTAYQTYSDGIVSFRVYRVPRSNVLYPALNDGALTVLRKVSGNDEYAVVGEVPLRLAEYVLSGN